jgi:hypothetical protein
MESLVVEVLWGVAALAIVFAWWWENRGWVVVVEFIGFLEQGDRYQFTLLKSGDIKGGTIYARRFMTRRGAQAAAAELILSGDLVIDVRNFAADRIYVAKYSKAVRHRQHYWPSGRRSIS